MSELVESRTATQIMRRSRIRVKSPKVARLDDRCKNALLDLRRVAATERKKRGRLNEVPRLIQFLAVASVFLPQKRVIMTLEGTHLVHLLPCNFFFFFWFLIRKVFAHVSGL